MKEVFACADRITILRGGRVMGTLLRSEADEKKLISLMFGKELADVVPVRERKQHNEPPLLDLHGVETRSNGMGVSLKDIHLKIYPGEIVGVAGVSGNGQRELCDLILGMIPCAKGRKYLFGKDVTHLAVPQIRRSGVGFIPENPLTMAVVPFMTVLENIVMTQTYRYIRWGGLGIDWLRLRSDVEAAMAKMGFLFSLFVPVHPETCYRNRINFSHLYGTTG
jgi:simple sugar transport system ATP-binding protein